MIQSGRAAISATESIVAHRTGDWARLLGKSRLRNVRSAASALPSGRRLTVPQSVISGTTATRSVPPRSDRPGNQSRNSVSQRRYRDGIRDDRHHDHGARLRQQRPHRLRAIAGHETCSVPFVSCSDRGDGVRSGTPATAVCRSDARSSYGRANELRARTGCAEERQRGEGRSTAPLRRSAHRSARVRHDN